MLWLFWLPFTCVNMCFGQTEPEELQMLLKHVPLPAAYMAKANVFNSLVDDGQKPVQRLQVWAGPDWVVGLLLKNQPGLGFIPFDYIHETDKESWRYHLSNAQAERTTSFNRIHSNSFETRLMPSGLIRQLLTDPPVVNNISSNDEDDITTVTIAPPGPKTPARLVLHFQNSTGFLKSVQRIGPAGKVAVETVYDDWRQLSPDSESFIPFIITQEFAGRDNGPPEMLMTNLVLDAKEIDSSGPPERLSLASNITIIDQIEGVTKTADGKVIGPIVRGKPAANANTVRTGPPGTTGLKPRLVMLVGVGLILLAGIILGFRRWRGA